MNLSQHLLNEDGEGRQTLLMEKNCIKWWTNS
jgi:hypothetical protein